MLICDDADFAEAFISEARQFLSEEELLGIVFAASAQLDWSQTEQWKTSRKKEAA